MSLAVTGCGEDASPAAAPAVVSAGGGASGGSGGAGEGGSGGASVDGPCAGVACSGHGQCVVEGGEASCACDEGFAAEGLLCLEEGPEPLFYDSFESGDMSATNDDGFSWANNNRTSVVTAERVVWNNGPQDTAAPAGSDPCVPT